MNMNFRAAGHRSLLTLSLAFVSVMSLSPIDAQEINGIKDLLGSRLPGQKVANAPEAKVTIAVQPAGAKVGETVTFTIKIDMPPGNHVYSMNPKFGGGTKVKFTAEQGVKSLGDFQPDHPPKSEFSKELEQTVEKYTKSVTWTRKYQVLEGTSSARLTGTLNYQVCNAQNCLPVKQPFDIEVPVSFGSAESTPVPKREAGNNPGVAQVDPFEITPETRAKHHAKAFIRLTPSDAQPGDEVSLQLQVKMEPEWHTYSLTQPEGNAAQTTEIELESHDGLEPVDKEFVANKEFERKELDDGPGKKKLIQEIYEDEVTWSRKFRLLPGTKLDAVNVTGVFRFQVCKGSCISSRIKFSLPRRDSEVAEKVEKPVATTIAPVPENGNPVGANKGPQLADLSDAECVAHSDGGDIRDRGVLHVMGVAFIFGWLALLTPCVFPMVPITVSFFLKQAEKKHNSPLNMAFVYCGSIIATFTVLGLVFSALFGAASITTLANGVLLNLFLGIVLMFFALNLLGMFEIQIPSWLLTFTASKESTSSYLGVFFMALTFTLTSFTCTFAFLGLILVWSANGDFWLPLASLISFSTAFALPFFLLALFPSYLHKLPKSGGWMNRVKVVMGLIEMAFMLKFLSVADISWNGTPTLLDYHMVMSAWMALSIVAGLYLIGKIQLPHDTKENYVGVAPMVVATGFFCLACYLAVGVFATEPPSGFLGQQIAAFAPPRLAGGEGEDGPYLVGAHDKQKYLLDFDRAKNSARKSQQPLFIDFTGVNCNVCRLMERKMASPGIQARLKRLVRTQLYTDVIPDEAVSDAKLSEEMLERNMDLQTKWYGNVSLPAYAVVSPDGKTILSKASGNLTPEEFTTFLECGINRWELSKRSDVASVKP